MEILGGSITSQSWKFWKVVSGVLLIYGEIDTDFLSTGETMLWLDWQKHWLEKLSNWLNFGCCKGHFCKEFSQFIWHCFTAKRKLFGWFVEFLSDPRKLTPNSSLLLDAKHSRLGRWMTRSYLGQPKSCLVNFSCVRFCDFAVWIVSSSQSQKDFHKLESAIGPGFCCDDGEASSQWG